MKGTICQSIITAFFPIFFKSESIKIIWSGNSANFKALIMSCDFMLRHSSPYTNLLFFAQLLTFKYTRWLLHYTKNTLSSLCTSLHKLEQKDRAKIFAETISWSTMLKPARLKKNTVEIFGANQKQWKQKRANHVLQRILWMVISSLVPRLLLHKMDKDGGFGKISERQFFQVWSCLQYK